MKKYIVTAFCLLLATTGAYAQVSVSYSVGYGDYKMKDMSNFLHTALQNVSPSILDKLSIVDDFPGSIIQNLNTTYSYKSQEFGLKGTYMYTGGKIGYNQDEERHTEKLNLTGFRIGALYRYHFYKAQMGDQSISLFGEISPAVTFTQLKYKTELQLPDFGVYEDNPQNKVNTNETGFSIQPLVGAQYFLTNNIFTTASVGYDIEFGTKLKVMDNKLKADWSGLRVDIGVGYKF